MATLITGLTVLTCYAFVPGQRLTAGGEEATMIKFVTQLMLSIAGGLVAGILLQANP